MQEANLVTGFAFSTVLDMVGVFEKEAAGHTMPHLRKAVTHIGRRLLSWTFVQEPCCL